MHALEGRGSPRGELRVKTSTLSALESLCIMLMTAAGPNGVSSWRRHLRLHLTFALTLASTLARSEQAAVVQPLLPLTDMTRLNWGSLRVPRERPHLASLSIPGFVLYNSNCFLGESA